MQQASGTVRAVARYLKQPALLTHDYSGIAQPLIRTGNRPCCASPLLS
jgi:hypothetical protein